MERLEALVQGISAAQGKAVPVRLDVTSVEDISRAVNEAEQALGPIDILVNNAGVSVSGKSVDMTPEDYSFVMDTNVRGAFFMATEIARRLIARKAPGRIINIASIGAFRVLAGVQLYNISKGAVGMMTKALAFEWARQNITVNAICPGYIATEMTSEWFETELGKKQYGKFVRRQLQGPEDLDGLLLLLSSDVSSGITGSVILADDGQSLGAIA
jgi:NAD(P)-dependent dehydrogenase (short-subunit alcohol dehydrogenase family)